MPNAEGRVRLLIYAGGAIVFMALATLNSGGYRYGASDQAFYIPAVLKQLDPALFPRDTALLASQARYFLVDEVVAAVIRATGWSIETCFAAGYALTLVVLYAGLWRFGSLVFSSPLAVWALLAAETLRHRITKTGVNTLEGYFHPRVLVFAVGIWSLATYLRGRPWLALGMVCVGGLLHPTTAAFFIVFLVPAIWTTEPGARRAIGVLATAGLIWAAWLLLAGPMRGSLEPMDLAWRELLASKDYLFPTRDWRVGAWFANLGTAALAIGGLVRRLRHEGTAPRERGLLAGAVALTVGFLITRPAVAAGSAIFVQLQISRAFWILDLLATMVLVGWLVDQPRLAGRPRRNWRTGVAILLVGVATARGVWVGLVEHGDRSLVALTLPEDEWTRVIRWVGTQPTGTHILADPGHAWKYGAPLRYAGRDVFLEEVKDVALAFYARTSAERVMARRAALGDFSALDATAARALAARFRLDYLVIDRDMDLPLAHREGGFRIYRLR
jgi:hypothetical protein